MTGNGSSASVICAALAAGDEIHSGEVRVGARIVRPRVATPALLAQQRRAGDSLRDGQHGLQVERHVPARIEVAVAFDAHSARRGASAARVSSSACCSSDSTRMMPTRFCMQSSRSAWTVNGFSPPSRVGRTARASRRWRRRHPPSRWRAGPRQVAGVLGGVESGPSAKHQQVRQRVAAESVGAVQTGRDFTRREQARHGRGGRIRFDADAAHHVVAGRPDLHRLRGDVHVGQLAELLIHRRQALA